SWDRVHDEAEVLEHVISEDLEQLIATRLGNPAVDPHGDPIPTADLRMDEPATRSLGTLEPGDRGRFVRVSDSDPAMLAYLRERRIAPGDAFEVVEQEPFGGPLLVRFGRTTHALGRDLARAMRVDAGDR
ncbi:MAG TPA: metal-dependent transcriptional regulator, partial [Gaiellales bacterium]|nr:metal-dependent transcriptional regulator [Gaiellales bacterium]